MNETVITLFGAIDRYWYNKNYLKSLSQETFSMEKLKTLHGVVFDGLTKFTDYTFFGKFIENGMITEESWSVTKCGYNPTFQKMRDKQYTQQD